MHSFSISWARLALASLALALSGFTAVAQAQTTPPAGYYTACKEGERCLIGPYFRDVAYGVSNGGMTKRTGVSGAFDCNSGTFGGDPAQHKAKYCYISTQESRRTGCAVEGGTCAISGTQSVMYGVDGRYAFAQKTGSFVCNAGAFGNADPYNGRMKACFIGAPY